jgi:hypothetical protein
MSFNEVKTLFHYIHFINRIRFLFLFFIRQQSSQSNIVIGKTDRQSRFFHAMAQN